MQNLGLELPQGIVSGISGLMSSPPPGSHANAAAAASPSSPSSTSSAASPAASSSPSDLVFATFNQDTTSLAVGTTSGYKLYSLTSTDSLDPIYENSSDGGVYIAERLFSSSLVAIVSNASPRKLKVCHFKKGTEICNYKYTSKILAVKMNRARLIVCLEESLFIHNIRDMKVLHTIRETPPNKSGLCALSTDSDNCYLAYPGHSSVGELQIFDALNLASTSMIPAHTGQLAAIAFNPSGTRIATASDKGTVIRVFNVADGSRVYELRRGLKRTADIYSLSFSPCGLYLACSSNTETVHVFKMDESPKDTGNDSNNSSPPGNSGMGGGGGMVGAGGIGTGGGGSAGGGGGSSDGSWMGYFSNVVSVSANYLPSQVTDTLLQGRAFATVHHNLYGFKNICALALIKKTLRLLLTSDNGYLYIYSLDTNEGGDCHMIRQFHLTSCCSESSAAAVGGQAAAAAAAARRHSESSINNEESCESQQQHHESSPVKTIPEDSEKFHEMALATETPPKQCFLLDDDGDFPPIGTTTGNGSHGSRAVAAGGSSEVGGSPPPTRTT